MGDNLFEGLPPPSQQKPQEEEEDKKQRHSTTTCSSSSSPVPPPIPVLKSALQYQKVTILSFPYLLFGTALPFVFKTQFWGV